MIISLDFELGIVSVQEKFIPSFGRVWESLLHAGVSVILTECYGQDRHLPFFLGLFVVVLFCWIRGIQRFLFIYPSFCGILKVQRKLTVLLKMY